MKQKEKAYNWLLTSLQKLQKMHTYCKHLFTIKTNFMITVLQNILTITFLKIPLQTSPAFEVATSFLLVLKCY